MSGRGFFSFAWSSRPKPAVSIHDREPEPDLGVTHDGKKCIGATVAGERMCSLERPCANGRRTESGKIVIRRRQRALYADRAGSVGVYDDGIRWVPIDDPGSAVP